MRTVLCALFAAALFASAAAFAKEDPENAFDLVDGPLAKVGFKVLIDSKLPAVNALAADYRDVIIEAFKSRGVTAIDYDRNPAAVQALTGSPLLQFTLHAHAVKTGIVIWSTECDFQEEAHISRTGADRMVTIARVVGYQDEARSMSQDLLGTMNLKWAALALLIAKGCAD